MPDNDFNTFQQVLKMTQPQLLHVMYELLKTRYKKVITHKNFVMAEGDIPIALVAHLDTVFKIPPELILYDREQNIMWGTNRFGEGTGFDDRAGVFAILQILKTTKLRPHIIFTTDEERGALGAIELITEYPKVPFDIKYIIQLDRQGNNDAVYYDGINRDFIDYTTSFGFKEQRGSFSDISVICPYWDRCGVNLSIGYMHEHTPTETLNVSSFYHTIQKVKRMLSARDTPDFKWEEKVYPQNYGVAYGQDDFDINDPNFEFQVICKKCKNTVSNYDAIPVKTRNHATVFYCCDCLPTVNLSWCEICGEAFEPKVDEPFCQDCYEDLSVHD